VKRRLGAMRHRLLIRVIGRTGDTGGGSVRSDTDGAEIWARVQTVSANEANVYMQRQQRVTHKAFIRWRADLAQGQTVVWQRPTAHGGNVSLYVVNVTDADPDRRPGEFMELALREGGPR